MSHSRHHQRPLPDRSLTTPAAFQSKSYVVFIEGEKRRKRLLCRPSHHIQLSEPLSGLLADSTSYRCYFPTYSFSSRNKPLPAISFYATISLHTPGERQMVDILGSSNTVFTIRHCRTFPQGKASELGTRM